MTSHCMIVTLHTARAMLQFQTHHSYAAQSWSMYILQTARVHAPRKQGRPDVVTNCCTALLGECVREDVCSKLPDAALAGTPVVCLLLAQAARSAKAEYQHVCALKFCVVCYASSHLDLLSWCSAALAFALLPPPLPERRMGWRLLKRHRSSPAVCNMTCAGFVREKRHCLWCLQATHCGCDPALLADQCWVQQQCCPATIMMCPTGLHRMFEAGLTSDQLPAVAVDGDMACQHVPRALQPVT